MAEHKPKMVFLTSPNNPDGSIMPDDEVRLWEEGWMGVRGVSQVETGQHDDQIQGEGLTAA